MDNKKIIISLSLAGIILSEIFCKKFYLISGFLLFVYLSFPKIAENIGEKIAFIGRLISKIFSYIFLVLVFYIVLFPVSIFYKIFHCNPLLLKNKGLSSTFFERNIEYKKNDFENIW